MARKLFVFVRIPGNKPGTRIGVVKFKEPGYYPTDFDKTSFGEPEEVDAVVKHYNDKLGIPVEVAESALLGSMFGWHFLGAAKAVEYFSQSGAA